MLLGELILLGKGDARLDMSCDGFVFEVDRVYASKYGSVILGDYEAQYNTSLEDIEHQTVGVITIEDKDSAYRTKLAFDDICRR